VPPETARFTREAEFINLLSKYEVLKKNFFSSNLTLKKGNTQQNLIFKIKKKIYISYVILEISSKPVK